MAVARNPDQHLLRRQDLLFLPSAGSGNGCDYHPAAGSMLDHSGDGKMIEGCAYRRAGDGKTRRQFVFAHLCADRQSVCADEPNDLIDQFLLQASRHSILLRVGYHVRDCSLAALDSITRGLWNLAQRDENIGGGRRVTLVTEETHNHVSPLRFYRMRRVHSVWHQKGII